MRSRYFAALFLWLVFAGANRALAAQEYARHQLTLDASMIAGAISYAWLNASGHRVGIGTGVGYELNVRLVHGEPWARKSADVAHLELFERLAPPGRWQYDVGVRAALDFHTAQVASEAEPGGFLGASLAPMWGGQHFRIGPRIQAGAYWSGPRPSLGLSIAPITARFLVTF